MTEVHCSGKEYFKKYKLIKTYKEIFALMLFMKESHGCVLNGMTIHYFTQYKMTVNHCDAMMCNSWSTITDFNTDF